MSSNPETNDRECKSLTSWHVIPCNAGGYHMTNACLSIVTERMSWVLQIQEKPYLWKTNDLNNLFQKQNRENVKQHYYWIRSLFNDNKCTKFTFAYTMIGIQSIGSSNMYFKPFQTIF